GDGDREWRTGYPGRPPRQSDAPVLGRLTSQALTVCWVNRKTNPRRPRPQEKTMPYRPPLVPYETFVADPVDLPVRPPGQQGLSPFVRAELLTVDSALIAVKGQTTDGATLVAEISAAGEGVIRVRLAQDADARTRSARAITMVHPGRDDAARVESIDGGLRLSTGPIVAEITLDPWHIRFLDTTGRLLVEENAGEVDISGRLR